MKLFIVAFFLNFAVVASGDTKALFSEKDLKLIEYYKSSEFLKSQRTKEIKSENRRRIELILNAMSKLDKESFEQKFKNNFWEKFDIQTDNALNRKIMLDLIMKDLYKEKE
ncbi:hypothetical protein [Halobacteriovorax sp. HLS]|uniref:hypothetical protein n=1 Tax=Halobacteriovorax sp. HLS TaxID=2234000 RepID=UPI000FDCB5BA|nr:hypothetical protein [Halobacteriovorax sp. HLS]